MTPVRSTVLVVEDDVDSRGLLQDVLESVGYLVETASDGAMALAYLAAGGIDLLVVDQMLPLVHGLELCRAVRGQRTDRYLPIIMVSALSGELHRHNAQTAGADVYLTKPVDIDELLYAVDRWAGICQRQKAQRQARIALMAEDRPANQSEQRYRPSWIGSSVAHQSA
jgi:DNA-binding response OmpR family regulator